MALELQFEYIDWNDIVDAELSGDTSKLDSLRTKSEELKRSFSLPTPPPPTHTSSSPPPLLLPRQSSSPNTSRDSGYFKVPRRIRGASRPILRTRPLAKEDSRPFEDWESEYPVLPSHSTPSSSSSLLPPSQCTSPVTENYAMVLSKRTFSDRNCVSPIECAAKRSALAGLVSSPPITGGGGGGGSEGFDFSAITPKEFTSSSCDQEQLVEYGTPDNDSRAAKVTGAVQRRLFPMTKENVTPRRDSTCSVSSDTKELTSLQISKRQKQIDFGKNTLGYQRYLQTIPKWQRKRGQPATPDKTELISTRCWQGRVKAWRRSLHSYDPPNEEGLTHFTAEEAALCDLDMSCELNP